MTTVLRILHAANFSWASPRGKRADNFVRHYATDHKLSNGLKRNGHRVWDFSVRDIARHLSPLGLGKRLGARRANGELLHTARQFCPHLLLLGHAELVSLKPSRQFATSCRIAKLPSGGWIRLPRTACRICGKSSHFWTLFLPPPRPRIMRPCLATESAAAPPRHYLPNVVDSSAETERAFAAPSYKYDLFFAGADAPERAAALRRLIAMPGLRFGAFGCNGNPAIGGAALASTIGQSKMGLNLSRANNIPLYSSDRIAQLTGNGCLAITPRVPQMAELFGEDEVAYYDEGDLTETVARYNKDDEARQRKAKAGWQRAHADYNERRVAGFIAAAAFGKDVSEYQWSKFSIASAGA